MQASVFLIISTLLIVKPTVNGLFLAKFGVEQLPYAFILVAVAAAIVSTAYTRLLYRINLYRIYRFTLIFSVVILVIFGVLLRTNVFESIVLYVFYIWVAIFALLTTSQFWILANLLFDPREAKRIFSFIGAGAIAGGIFGGYLTSIVSNNFSSEYLPVIAAIILMPTIWISQHLWDHYLKAEAPLQTAVSQTQYDTRHPFQILRESRHLSLIAGIVGVSVMVAKLVDYQFGGIASELIPDPDELTAFFGFWFSTFNVISLFLQLFVTRNIVGTYGVGSSLFILPSTIMIAVLILFVFPELLFAVVLLKMSDGGIKNSINKAAMELLIMPVPQELKNKTKTFIDVFVDSLATGLIGLILIFFIKGLGLSFRSVSALIMVLIGVWIYLASLVRKEYLNTITLKLKALNPNQKDLNFDFSNQSVFQGIVEVLSTGTEEQKLFMLQKVRSHADARLLSTISSLLDAPSPKIRAEALQNLHSYNDELVKEKVRGMTEDQNQSVKVWAIKYLIRNEIDKNKIVELYINDPDLKVWGATLVGLARETRYNKGLASKTNLKRHINLAIKRESSSTDAEEKRFISIAILKAIGHSHLQEFYTYIDSKLEDQDPFIREHACLAAGETQSDFFFDSLLSQASQSHGALRNTLIRSMAFYDSYFLVLLNQWYQDNPRTDEIKRLVPLVLKNISKQASVDYLFTLLSDKNSSIRREAIRALNHLKNTSPHLWFDNSIIAGKLKQMSRAYLDLLTVLSTQADLQNQDEKEEEIARDSLVKLLERRLDRSLEIIFRLLGLRYSAIDIVSVYKGLKSDKMDLRTSAMELIDNILDRDLRQTLLPLIESTMLEQITTDAIKQLKLSVPNEIDSYNYLLEYGDEKIILAVLFLLKHRKEIMLNDHITKLQDHANDNIKMHTRELLESYASRVPLITSE